MKSVHRKILCASLLIVMQAANGTEFAFPTAVQYLKGRVAAPFKVFVGAPDSRLGAGAGETWGGLGDGYVIYDFLRYGDVDDPQEKNSDPEVMLRQGNGIVDVPGLDVLVFEAIGGRLEPQFILVEVSNDLENWTDLTATRQLVGPFPELKGSSHPSKFTMGVDIASHGPVARYLRVKGIGETPPGQVPENGNGFDLDAVGVAVRGEMRWEIQEADELPSSPRASDPMVRIQAEELGKGRFLTRCWLKEDGEKERLLAARRHPSARPALSQSHVSRSKEGRIALVMSDDLSSRMVLVYEGRESMVISVPPGFTGCHLQPKVCWLDERTIAVASLMFKDRKPVYGELDLASGKWRVCEVENVGEVEELSALSLSAAGLPQIQCRVSGQAAIQVASLLRK